MCSVCKPARHKPKILSKCLKWKIKEVSHHTEKVKPENICPFNYKNKLAIHLSIFLTTYPV